MDTYLLFVQTSQGQIKGNSAFPGHQGWIEVESASFGNLALTEENAPAIQRSTSGAGAGKVTFNPFSITKAVDSASPKLFQAATRGETVVKVVVECASGQHITHRLTITGGKLSVKPAGPGKEAIIFVGGHMTYN
jgi:type VI secretion system Hcp family effector